LPSDFLTDLLKIVSSTAPILAAVVVVLGIAALAGRTQIRFGKFMLNFDRTRVDEETIRRRLENATDFDKGSQQYVLLKEYHSQGLAQSRMSFWFSLIFASIGFAVIALSIGIFLQQSKDPSVGWLEGAGKPIFTLVAGTIIDAVAGLFFVQSNKARQLMVEFFDKLRIDRKLDEALRLADSIEDKMTASHLKALLSLNFAEISVDRPLFETVIRNGKQLSEPEGPP
jgi:TRADD-N domain-containing protein